MTSATEFFLVIGGSCFGVMALALCGALLDRKAEIARTDAEPPKPVAWPESSRPLRCQCCGNGELVCIPEVFFRRSQQLSREISTSSSIEMEAMACGACGRLEWYVSSPAEVALEPL
jgi:hypothetical protein